MCVGSVLESAIPYGAGGRFNTRLHVQTIGSCLVPRIKTTGGSRKLWRFVDRGATCLHANRPKIWRLPSGLSLKNHASACTLAPLVCDAKRSRAGRSFSPKTISGPNGNRETRASTFLPNGTSETGGEVGIEVAACAEGCVFGLVPDPQFSAQVPAKRIVVIGDLLGRRSAEGRGPRFPECKAAQQCQDDEGDRVFAIPSE